MGKMFNEVDLDVMQLVRCAFDPDGICNPGKVFPTPRLCGERPGRRTGAAPAAGGRRCRRLLSLRPTSVEELSGALADLVAAAPTVAVRGAGSEGAMGRPRATGRAGGRDPDHPA